MLKQADTAMIETVMHSVSVFARMRSHQKGQVMDLLGRRGLFQSVQDQQHHIPVSVQLAVHESGSECPNSSTLCL